MLHYLVVRKKLSWQQIDRALGKEARETFFPMKTVTFSDFDLSISCKLAPGIAHRRIYRDPDSEEPRIIHIWKHPDGVCITPALDVASDNSYAKEVYDGLQGLDTAKGR